MLSGCRSYAFKVRKHSKVTFPDFKESVIRTVSNQGALPLWRAASMLPQENVINQLLKSLCGSNLEKMKFVEMMSVLDGFAQAHH